MKEQVLLYGVCAAISIASVAVTSLMKIIVCAIAKRCGKSVSGNVKEYIFTPIALLLAAGALYVWLDRFMCIEDEQLFILITVCFSVGTMLIYWLLFQPTRKAARSVIRTIARCFNVEPVVDVVQEVMAAEDEEKPDEPEEKPVKGLQSNAERKGESPSPAETEIKADAAPPDNATDAADKLRAMVEAIKKK